MHSRDFFKSKAGFIASAAGAAVGLGNVWKFPFEVHDGGGAAFVAVYLIICLFFGFPIMVTCIAIGRAGKSNIVGAFRRLGHPRWNFIGKIGVFLQVLILSFYFIVAGWSLQFFLELTMGNFEIGKQFPELGCDLTGMFSYWILFAVATGFVVSKGVSSGIEKVAKTLMPMLFILVLALAVYALTLPQAKIGLAYYMIPDFSKLTLEKAFSAIGQAFFSLSICGGIIITYGSYLSDQENIISSSAIVTIADVVVALVAGVMIFPLVAFLNEGDMSGVSGGAGLIFSVLPGGFESLGVAGRLVGALFFLLLAFAALTSTVSMMEVPTAFLVEEFQLSRITSAIYLLLLTLIVAVPSILSNGYSSLFTNFVTYPGADSNTDFMIFLGQLIDSYFMLSGCLIVVFAHWIWKTGNMRDEIAKGNPGYRDSPIEKLVNLTIGYLIPPILGYLFLAGVLTTFFGISIF